MTITTPSAGPTSLLDLARTRAWLTAALLLALAPIAGCRDGATVAPSRTGLIVSDFHFNPLADQTPAGMALADRLVQAPHTEWDAIFAASSQLAYSPYGQDTNFLLLQSALAAMRARAPAPDIVLISGDLLVHDLNLYFTGAVTQPTTAGYEAFAEKTEQYLAMKLSRAFPEAQIVPALGDWDGTSAPTGYPAPAFLAAFAAAWTPAVNRLGGAPDIQSTFAAGGYYATGFPVDPKGRLLVLNTLPWAAECSTGCGSGAGSPGAIELAWLAAQLADARAQGQRIWLLGHIPPGIEAGRATGGASCAASITPFYAEPFLTQLQALFLQYGDLITFAIYAHEHADDYRVVKDGSGNPLFGMKLIPSITPIAASNPAFVQFAYDPVSGTMTSATKFDLTNLSVATTTVPGVWETEYDFNQTYGQSAFDSNGLADAVARIKAGGAAQSAFTTYFPLSNPAGSPPGPFADFLAYGCTLDSLTVADYTACFCKG
jgi:sphingomyelin phosphodiesterase acid-like 3